MARITGLRAADPLIREVIHGFHIEGPFISPVPGCAARIQLSMSDRRIWTPCDGYWTRRKGWSVWSPWPPNAMTACE